MRLRKSQIAYYALNVVYTHFPREKQRKTERERKRETDTAVDPVIQEGGFIYRESLSADIH